MPKNLWVIPEEWEKLGNIYDMIDGITQSLEVVNNVEREIIKYENMVVDGL